MAAKLTRMTHKISIQLHPVAKSWTICSSRSRRPVRKLLDSPPYTLFLCCPAYIEISQWADPPHKEFNVRS